MSEPDMLVVRITYGTWKQRTVARLRSPAAARTLAAARRGLAWLTGRRHTYDTWEDPHA
jgi:hypothetical protein